MPTTQDYRNMVAELNKCDDDVLTEWECDFLDDMARHTADYKLGQQIKIAQIWDRIFGGDGK